MPKKNNNFENSLWKVFEQDLLASIFTDFLPFASRSARPRIYAPTAPDLRIRPLARLILGCVYRTRSSNPVSVPHQAKGVVVAARIELSPSSAGSS